LTGGEQGYHKDTSVDDVEGRYNAQWVVSDSCAHKLSPREIVGTIVIW
jgi:hypothetical protein